MRTVRDILVPLHRARILASVEAPEGGGSGWQLGKPAEKIQAVDVLTALRGSREPIAGETEVTRAVESLLAEIHGGEVKAARGQSLAHLLARIPKLSPKPQA